MLDRRPCMLAPFHHRLDWQLWVAAFQGRRKNPWINRLADMMLANHKHLDSLLSVNPFHDGLPPTRVRAKLYRYTFSKGGSSNWWDREFVDEFITEVRKDELMQ